MLLEQVADPFLFDDSLINYREKVPSTLQVDPQVNSRATSGRVKSTAAYQAKNIQAQVLYVLTFIQ